MVAGTTAVPALIGLSIHDGEAAPGENNKQVTSARRSFRVETASFITSAAHAGGRQKAVEGGTVALHKNSTAGFGIPNGSRLQLEVGGGHPPTDGSGRSKLASNADGRIFIKLVVRTIRESFFHCLRCNGYSLIRTGAGGLYL